MPLRCRRKDGPALPSGRVDGREGAKGPQPETASARKRSPTRFTGRLIDELSLTAHRAGRARVATTTADLPQAPIEAVTLNAVARVVTAHIVPGGFHALSRTRPVSAVGAGTLTSPKDPRVVRARVRRARVLNQTSFEKPPFKRRPDRSVDLNARSERA